MVTPVLVPLTMMLTSLRGAPCEFTTLPPDRDGRRRYFKNGWNIIFKCRGVFFPDSNDIVFNLVSEGLVFETQAEHFFDRGILNVYHYRG